jgi:hypothetical protein
MSLREGFIEKPEQPKPDKREHREHREPRQVEPATAATGATVESLVPQPDWPVTIKLRRSIIGNRNEQVTELVFREPYASDILRCGNPVYLNGAGELMLDERKMMAIIAQLSGVLQPLLDKMSPKDWATCAYRLLPFFVPDWAAF